MLAFRMLEAASQQANATDPYWANVLSLLHFDGTNGSTIFTDQKSRIWTPSGNAQISTAQSEFGGASGYFDGVTGSYIHTPYTTDLNWWTADFTIEIAVYAANLSTFSYTSTGVVISSLLGCADPASATNYWSFGPLADGTLAFYYYNGNPQRIVSTATIAANTWTNIAMRLSSGTIQLYIGSTLVASGAVSGTPQSSTSLNLVLGQINNRPINGYTDELRITGGVARTIVVPTAPWPNS